LTALLSKKIFWFYVITIGFLLVNTFFIYKENYFFLIIPFAVLVLLITIFALDRLLLLAILLVPLSIPLSYIIPGLSFNMAVPTEPILFGIMLIFFIKLFMNNNIDKRIIYHPISIIIYLQIFWLIVTSLTSTLPIVSFKFTLVRIWFVVSFFFLLIILFKDLNKYKTVIWLYASTLIIAIAYTLINHASYGLFDQQAANYVSYPLYNDHTAYGAALAMIFTMLVGFLFLKNYPVSYKWIAFIFILIVFVAIVFSYTRATWLSMAIAFGFLIIFVFKIKFHTILIIAVFSTALIGVFWTDIIQTLEKNRQDSSSDIAEQIRSISNITTDASNLERLNRWNCAIRMYNEKPVLGWGPGTYAMQYAPFQRSYDRTIISTNTGNRGNAHSEYLGPLSETGLPGAVLMLILIFATIYNAMKVYHKLNDNNLKILVASTLLALITYYVHGALNNFLDTDKLSVLFWGFTAFIVAVDIYVVSNNKKNDNIIQ